MKRVVGNEIPFSFTSSHQAIYNQLVSKTLKEFPVALVAGGFSSDKSMAILPASETVGADHPVSSSSTTTDCLQPVMKHTVVSSPMLVSDGRAQSKLRKRAQTASSLHQIEYVFIFNIPIIKCII